MFRCLAPCLLAAAVLATTSCAASGTASPQTDPQSPPSSAAAPGDGGESATTAGSAVESVEETRRQFLNVVCYTDTALQNLLSVANASGGWGALPAKDARTYAQSASDAAQEAVRRLQETEWPDSVRDQMTTVETEYLAMLRPLQQIAQSPKAEDRSQAWRELKAQERIAEQQVRLTLELEPVDSLNDGCPPPVAVKPARKDPPESSAGGGGAAAAGWTDHWMSPSGNIRCGYNPAGSRGAPVVACVVSDESTYMKLTQGVGAEGPLSATTSTFGQLSVSGARTLGYGQTTNVGPFTCSQSPADGIGMSCWLTSTLQGFTIKRGTYWSY